jgi:hypothetical protein
MPLLSVNIEEASAATALQPVEKGFYKGHIIYQDLVDIKLPSRGQQVRLQVEIDEGEYRGRRIPGGPNQFCYAFQKGIKVNDDGTEHPYDLGKMYDLINALKATWLCKNCGQSSTKKFVKEKGKYFSPCCGKTPLIDFDTDEWIGLRANWQVDTEKQQNSDDLRNVIKGARPLE